MKTAKENRRANVKKLVEQHGGQAEFAKKIGKDPAQISQWATAAKSHRGKPRGMSDDMARYIEKKCGLDRGWMDIDHSSEQGEYRVLPASRPDENVGAAYATGRPISIEVRKMKPGEVRPQKPHVGAVSHAEHSELRADERPYGISKDEWHLVLAYRSADPDRKRLAHIALQMEGRSAPSVPDLVGHRGPSPPRRPSTNPTK